MISRGQMIICGTLWVIKSALQLNLFTQFLQMKVMLASNAIKRFLIQICRALPNHLVIKGPSRHFFWGCPSTTSHLVRLMVKQLVSVMNF